MNCPIPAEKPRIKIIEWKKINNNQNQEDKEESELNEEVIKIILFTGESICKENNIDFWEIESPNGHILTKLISLIYILDYGSIYKAILDKTDPSPVKSIDYVKQNL